MEIKNDEKINKSFLSASLNELDINCKIYKGNFYSDSFKYFPITENFEVFQELYANQQDISINNYFSKKFYDNFEKNMANFKNIDNVYLLGSSPGDNYFSNLIYFLPRLYFNNQKETKLAIHRNLSNKFRNFIKRICNNLLQKKITFTYLDDEFYKFNNSFIPQFLKVEDSIKILKFFFNNVSDNNEKKIKLYITRQNSDYRKLLNESDVIPLLKKNNFKIVNLQNFEIKEQIKLFTSADVVVSTIGSTLTNIIFCKKGTKVYEIAPDFTHSYEKYLSGRYEALCKLVGLNYYKIRGDSVAVKTHSKIAKKYISKKVLEESSYYKDIIIKINDLNKYFD